ncbi:MAG: hypothetical protein ACI4DY_13355 [Monoglobaceae bacterium]
MPTNYSLTPGVTVNKILKADYDVYVEQGIITQQMIDNEAWIFIDDNFLSAENLAKLNALDLNNLGEANAIDGVTVNGAAVTPDENKVINIVIPTKLSDLTDDVLPAWAKAETKPSYSYSEITDKPTLAAVATSGSYNDLTDKPEIPTGSAVTRIWNSAE